MLYKDLQNEQRKAGAKVLTKQMNSPGKASIARLHLCWTILYVAVHLNKTPKQYFMTNKWLRRVGAVKTNHQNGLKAEERNIS